MGSESNFSRWRRGIRVTWQVIRVSKSMIVTRAESGAAVRPCLEDDVVLAVFFVLLFIL